MTESAVRFFRPDHPQLGRMLLGRLREAHAKVAAELLEGYAKDWADYKERLGVINGLKLAIEECEATQKDMER